MPCNLVFVVHELTEGKYPLVQIINKDIKQDRPPYGAQIDDFETPYISVSILAPLMVVICSHS